MRLTLVGTEALHEYADADPGPGVGVNPIADAMLGAGALVHAPALIVHSVAGSDACVLALHPTFFDGAIEISGTNVVELRNCGMAIRSTSFKALKLSGTVDLEAEYVCVVDAVGVEQSGTVRWLPDPPGDSVIETLCEPPRDPLANLRKPPVGGCDFNDYIVPDAFSVVALDPGVYCGGITISGSDSTITFNPGNYIIKGGGMNFAASNNDISGSGVMFFNTDQAGTFGDIQFSGSGSNIDLSAPTSGPYAGVLFYQDPEAAPGDFIFKVNGDILAGSFDGTIYMPEQLVEYSGNSAAGEVCGPKIIAYTIKLSGNGGVVFGGDPDCASQSPIFWAFTPLVM